MTRTEYTDHVANLRKELAFYEAVKPGCMGCSFFADSVCNKHGPVPADFIAAGCDEWNFDDVPF